MCSIEKAIQIVSLFVLCYLLGSIPTALIIGKIFKGIDIRKYGSGNPGATNVFRTVGILPGIITLIIDCTKGFIAVFLSKWLYPTKPLIMLCSGLLSVIGHNWSIYLNFAGGKGVATTLGVVLGLRPDATFIGFLAFFIVLVALRYVSLSSICAAIVVPCFLWLRGEYVIINIFITLLALLLIFRHKENIKRLLTGTEHKIHILRKTT